MERTIVEANESAARKAESVARAEAERGVNNYYNGDMSPMRDLSVAARTAAFVINIGAPDWHDADVIERLIEDRAMLLYSAIIKGHTKGED